MAFTFQDRKLHSLEIKNVILIKLLLIFLYNSDTALGFTCLSIHKNIVKYGYNELQQTFFSEIKIY
jgi:hypothetical protein